MISGVFTFATVSFYIMGCILMIVFLKYLVFVHKRKCSAERGLHFQPSDTLEMYSLLL